MFRLDGKVALVTGSNRGLGAAIALGFAQAGAEVVLHDIAAPEETAKRIGEMAGVRTHSLAADLSSRAQADRLIEEAVAAMGAVDILVNNAGIIRRAPAVEHSDEDWDAVIEINLTAVFRLCRAAGAHMLARGSEDRQHRVAALLPGRNQRALLLGGQRRSGADHQGAGQ